MPSVTGTSSLQYQQFVNFASADGVKSGTILASQKAQNGDLTIVAKTKGDFFGNIWRNKDTRDANDAIREAFKQAAPKIKEPIYDIAVTVPTEAQGGVMTDLQGRRAIVMGMDAEGKYTTLKAKAPLAEMNRYCTALSSLTSGRGTFTMTFSSYELVPADVQQALLKAYEEAAAEEE